MLVLAQYGTSLEFDWEKGFKDLEVAFCSSVDCGDVFQHYWRVGCQDAFGRCACAVRFGTPNTEAEARQSCFRTIVVFPLLDTSWKLRSFFLYWLGWRGHKSRSWFFYHSVVRMPNAFALNYCRNKPEQQTDLQYLPRADVLCVFHSRVNTAIMPVSDTSSFTWEGYFRLWFSAPVYHLQCHHLTEQYLLGMIFYFWQL